MSKALTVVRACPSTVKAYLGKDTDQYPQNHAQLQIWYILYKLYAILKVKFNNSLYTNINL